MPYFILFLCQFIKRWCNVEPRMNLQWRNITSWQDVKLDYSPLLVIRSIPALPTHLKNMRTTALEQYLHICFRVFIDIGLYLQTDLWYRQNVPSIWIAFYFQSCVCEDTSFPSDSILVIGLGGFHTGAPSNGNGPGFWKRVSMDWFWHKSFLSWFSSGVKTPWHLLQTAFSTTWTP